MIVKCEKCRKWYDDEWRLTTCPHDTFMANDGENNFLRNEDAYLSKTAPRKNPSAVSSNVD